MSGKTQRRPVLIVALSSLFVPHPTWAHVAVEGADNFTAGMLHPFFVLPHVLVILALGLFLDQQGMARMRLALAAFVIALATGFGGAALDLAALVPLRGLLLGTALCLGLLVAWGRALPFAAAPAAAVAGFAIALDSLPDDGSVLADLISAIGTSLSLSFALLNVLAFASLLTRGWQRIGLRVLGSWIGASALMVAALSLR